MKKTMLRAAYILALLLFAACAKEPSVMPSATQPAENTGEPSPEPVASAEPTASVTPTQAVESYAPTLPVPAASAEPIASATSAPPTAPQRRTFLAYVKRDPSATSASGETLAILADKILWIDGDDEKMLRQYGIEPDDVDNDYAIVNEAEEWESYSVAAKASFFVQYTQDYELDPREVEREEFAEYLAQTQDNGILAEVTVADGREVTRIAEVYTP